MVVAEMNWGWLDCRAGNREEWRTKKRYFQAGDPHLVVAEMNWGWLDCRAGNREEWRTKKRYFQAGDPHLVVAEMNCIEHTSSINIFIMVGFLFFPA